MGFQRTVPIADYSLMRRILQITEFTVADKSKTILGYSSFVAPPVSGALPNYELEFPGVVNQSYGES